MTDFNSTILGGLPVSVEVTWNPAEPEIGIWAAYPEIDSISLVRKRKRDGRVIYRAIPDSWEARMTKAGDYDRLLHEAQGGW